MEEKKAIFGYTVRFNRAKLGLVSAKVLIDFQYITPARREEFLKYCDAHPSISYFGILMGWWDMEIDLDVHDLQELYSVLRQIHGKFHDVIRDTSVLPKIREFNPNPVAHLARKAILKSDVPKFSV